MSTPSIRRLGGDDLAQFRAIRLEALSAAPSAFGSTHAAEAARPETAFAARLADAAIFGAFSADAIVGMAGLTQNTGARERHKAFLWGVYVRQAFRGTGCAGRLLDAALDHADGIVAQVTLTVTRGNAAASRLYRSRGFILYGTEPRALRDGADYLDEDLMVRFRGGGEPRP